MEIFSHHVRLQQLNGILDIYIHLSSVGIIFYLHFMYDICMFLLACLKLISLKQLMTDSIWLTLISFVAYTFMPTANNSVGVYVVGTVSVACYLFSKTFLFFNNMHSILLL